MYIEDIMTRNQNEGSIDSLFQSFILHIEDLIENEIYQASLRDSMDTYNEELFKKRQDIVLDGIVPFSLTDEIIHEMKTDTKCFICLEEFKIGASVIKLPCSHIYHVDCMNTLISHQHAKCPLCRGPLPLQTLQNDSGHIIHYTFE